MSNNNNKQTLRWWISTRNLFRDIHHSVLPFVSFIHWSVLFGTGTSHARGDFISNSPPSCIVPLFSVPFFMVLIWFLLIEVTKKKPQQQVKKSLWFSRTKEFITRLVGIGLFSNYSLPFSPPPPHPTPPPNIFSFPNKNYNIRWVMVWSNVYQIAILLFHKMFEFINFPNKKPLGIENCINWGSQATHKN